MKKLLKKLDIVLLIPIILMNLLQGQLYYIAKLSPVPFTVVNSALDNSLPLITLFAYPYVLWHVLLFAMPYFIYKHNKEAFHKYITANTITIIICFIIFVLFPTYFVRPDIEVNSLSTLIIELVYLGDTPALNCFPSFHCTTSFFFIYIFILEKGFSKNCRIVSIFTFMLIVLSTMFIKQHAIIDVLGALLIVTIVYGFVCHFKIWKKFEQIYNRIVLLPTNVIKKRRKKIGVF